MNKIRHLVWLIPLLLYSSDALAWGLYTHVYFAQQLVWAIPLTDPRFRRALFAFPNWVMAGSCLPDLSLTGSFAGTENFNQTHQWSTAKKLLEQAACDQERAIALGYASHLLVDIIAHNYFVPAHESMWLNLPILTHACSEWAMDAHVKKYAFSSPSHLLRQNRDGLARFAAQHFACEYKQAERAIVLLEQADGILRSSAITEAIYHTGKVLDRNLQRRFNYYLRETSRRLVQINRMLAGDYPAWHADPPNLAPQRVGPYPTRQLKHRLPLPLDLFMDAEQLTDACLKSK